jgi:hypothetical protein
MFKQNKYSKCYYNIISAARQRILSGYVERHHIVPKSLGGSNDASNIVALTAREHFICHLLLIRMVSDDVKHKMVYAAWQQSRPSKHKTIKITARTYEVLKRQLSESLTGRKRKPFSEQAKVNMKASAVNRAKVVYTPERLTKLANTRPNVAGWNKGVTMDLSDEHREAISSRLSLANKGRPKPKVVCPHCANAVANHLFKRWHGDNCKLKS